MSATCVPWHGPRGNTGLSKHGDPAFPHFCPLNQNLLRVGTRGVTCPEQPPAPPTKGGQGSAGRWSWGGHQSQGVRPEGEGSREAQGGVPRGQWALPASGSNALRRHAIPPPPPAGGLRGGSEARLPPPPPVRGPSGERDAGREVAFRLFRTSLNGDEPKNEARGPSAVGASIS